MKTRNKIRTLFAQFSKEVNSTLHNNHDHEPFSIKGTGCLLCCLIGKQYNLGSLQILREQGFCTNWFQSEIDLCKLIGEKALKMKILRELDIIKNFPKQQCQSCKGTVYLFLTPSELFHWIMGPKENWAKATKIVKESLSVKKYKVNCTECGVPHFFSIQDITHKLYKSLAKRYLRALRKHQSGSKDDINAFLNFKVQFTTESATNLMSYTINNI